MADEKLDPDFANLRPVDRAEIESLSGIGLHHAPDNGEAPLADDAFTHPVQDGASTVWEPIDSYQDGEVVMLDDGSRQLLGKREMGLWMELIGGDEHAQPDYQPTLWSPRPSR